MANADRKKLIRIYGVTLPTPGGRLRPYGHGRTSLNYKWVDYVDYFIEDLIKYAAISDLDIQIKSAPVCKEIKK